MGRPRPERPPPPKAPTHNHSPIRFGRPLCNSTPPASSTIHIRRATTSATPAHYFAAWQCWRTALSDPFHHTTTARPMAPGPRLRSMPKPLPLRNMAVLPPPTQSPIALPRPPPATPDFFIRPDQHHTLAERVCAWSHLWRSKPPRTHQDTIRLMAGPDFTPQALATRILGNIEPGRRPCAQADLLRRAAEAAFGTYLEEELVRRKPHRPLRLYAGAPLRHCMQRRRC